MNRTEDVRVGETGFWQHWWQQVDQARDSGEVPLAMDIVVADDGIFEERQWLRAFDPEIRDFVLREGLLAGRAIVPPGAIGSPAEPLLELGLESGFEVRVLSTDARFVLYAQSTAVVSVDIADDDGSELHRAVRGPAILAQLTSYFELLWQLAVPLPDYKGEKQRILGLLAQGWTDVRIADELGISLRTVSRRVSEAMDTHRALSRFELGYKYALEKAILA